MKRRRSSGKHTQVVGPRYAFRLYITGVTPRSTKAVVNLKTICEQYFHGRYALEIIDLYQQPELSVKEQIIASPTLVRRRPLPLRHFVGDMTEAAKVIAGLGAT